MNCLELFCMGHLSLLPSLLVSLFNHVFISGWTHGVLKIYWIIIQSNIIQKKCFFFLNCVSLGHWDLFQLTPVPFRQDPIFMGFCCLGFVCLST